MIVVNDPSDPSEPVMDAYLQPSDVIDWQHPAILAVANELAASSVSASASDAEAPAHQRLAIAKTCFEWVRDQIHHSVDYQLNPVTWKASDVLQHRTGYCYAKSHLLAALLRANGIPTGFCYQRLSIDDQGAPYCLHGLNAVYLADQLIDKTDGNGCIPEVDAPETRFLEETGFLAPNPPDGNRTAIGWYRVDPRGNRSGINAQFTPPVEQLAYQPKLPGEMDGQTIFPEPLPVVLDALKTFKQWEELFANLPDIDFHHSIF